MEKWVSSVVKIAENDQKHLEFARKACEELFTELKNTEFFRGKRTEFREIGESRNVSWVYHLWPIPKFEIKFREVLKNVEAPRDEHGYRVPTDVYTYEQIKESIKYLISLKAQEV